MKWKNLLLAVLMMACLGLPRAVHAGDEGWAALGGFLGGVLLSQGHHHEHRTVIREKIYHRERVSQGHYEYQTRRIWHPGRFVHVRRDCGRVRRVWEPGYYQHEKVKVWVPSLHVSYRSGHRSGCDW